MDDFSRVSRQPEDGQRGQSFRSIEHLLADWLAGARLVEALRIVQQVRAELSRRGIVLNCPFRRLKLKAHVELRSRDQEPSQQPVCTAHPPPFFFAQRTPSAAYPPPQA